MKLLYMHIAVCICWIRLTLIQGCICWIRLTLIQGCICWIRLTLIQGCICWIRLTLIQHCICWIRLTLIKGCICWIRLILIQGCICWIRLILIQGCICWIRLTLIQGCICWIRLTLIQGCISRVLPWRFHCISMVSKFCVWKVKKNKLLCWGGSQQSSPTLTGRIIFLLLLSSSFPHFFLRFIHASVSLLGQTASSVICRNFSPFIEPKA